MAASASDLICCFGLEGGTVEGSPDMDTAVNSFGGRFSPAVSPWQQIKTQECLSSALPCPLSRLISLCSGEEEQILCEQFKACGYRGFVSGKHAGT